MTQMTKEKIVIEAARQRGWDAHKAVTLARWEDYDLRALSAHVPQEYLERGRHKEAVAFRDGWDRYADCIGNN
jgi:hypothetical protein